MWFHNSEYLDLIDVIVLHAAVRRTSMYLYILVMYFCFCGFLCRYTAVAAAVLVLLAAAVRHRVPDDATFFCCCGLLMIPVFFMSLFKQDLFSCTPCQYCRMYSLDSPKTLYYIS